MTELENVRVAIRTGLLTINGAGIFTNKIIQVPNHPDKTLAAKGAVFPFADLWLEEARFEDEADLDEDIGKMPITAEWMIELWIIAQKNTEPQTQLFSLLEDVWLLIKSDPTWGGLTKSTELVDLIPAFSQKQSIAALKLKTNLEKAR